MAQLAHQLIRRRSITPDDAGCQEIIARRLEPLGFVLESIRRGEVSNLWARRGRAKPVERIAAGAFDALKSTQRQVLERLLPPT